MTEKLVDFILAFAHFFCPAFVMAEYSRGVVLRFGKFHRLAEPGFHLLWPFNIEKVLYTNVVPETVRIGPQSLTTKCGKSVSVSTIVMFSVTDVKTFLLTIEGANQVIDDASFGMVSEFIMKHSWEELVTMKNVAVELTKLARSRAEKYGVRIESVRFRDFTQGRVLRLMQEDNSKQTTGAWQ